MVFLNLPVTFIDTHYNTHYNVLAEGDAMKSYSSRKIISIIEADIWYFVHSVGDHRQFKHPTKPGRVTVTHPVKDIPMKTVLRIFNQAKINLP
jgi:predicted RNA binding protein YcfA (HicA-like mRNA interferase family)